MQVSDEWTGKLGQCRCPVFFSAGLALGDEGGGRFRDSDWLKRAICRVNFSTRATVATASGRISKPGCLTHIGSHYLLTYN